LKAFAPSSRRARLTLIIVNDDDLVVAPAQCGRAPAERILPLGTLDILDNLSHRRLPDVQVGAALEMARLDFDRRIHGALRLRIFIAIAANT
jgi:hypothetical protein